MSPIWTSLPRELVDKILDDHITNHLPPAPPIPQRPHKRPQWLRHMQPYISSSAEDWDVCDDEWPNNTFYAWLTLRNAFNSVIKRRVERYYWTYVLPIKLHLALYTYRSDPEGDGNDIDNDTLNNDARDWMHARHYGSRTGPREGRDYIRYGTWTAVANHVHVAPPPIQGHVHVSDEDEDKDRAEAWAPRLDKDWQWPPPPVVHVESECDDDDKWNINDDKLTLFRWPDMEFRNQVEDCRYGEELCKRLQEEEKATAKGFWGRYAEALNRIGVGDMRRGTSRGQGEVREEDLEEEETKAGVSNKVLPNNNNNNNDEPPWEIRRVSVTLWNCWQPRMYSYPGSIDHAYVRPEGFELPGFEMVEQVLEDMEGHGQGQREGATAPEVCVRFRWREVVTVLLRRLERGMDEEERKMAEDWMERERQFGIRGRAELCAFDLGW